MTDTPNHDDAVSLDSVLDELLADAARESATAVDGSSASGSAPDAAAAVGRAVDPEAVRSDSAAASTAAPVASGPLDNDGEIDGFAAGPSDNTSADSPGVSLEASLDGLLKQAQELHETVAEVAPERLDEIAPPPMVSDVRADARAAESTAEGCAPERVSETSIQSLDAELAALTDDLLAGEIEAPPTDAPSNAPVQPKLSVSDPEPVHAAAAGAVVAGAPAVSRVAEGVPVAARPAGPSLASRVLPVLKRGAAAASEPARIALGLVSAPLIGKRSLQQSIGWLAAYTVFLASALWIYLVAFHTPQGPVATSVPSSLHSEGHGGGHDDAHGGDGHHGTSEDGHGAGDHATDSPGAGGHGAESKQGAKSGGSGHGEPKSASSAHDAPKAEAHGAKAEGHAAGAHEIRVVNGYAVSKNAPAKAGAKPPAKDAHGAKTEAKSGGH
jgi:hypothetical protein